VLEHGLGDGCTVWVTVQAAAWLEFCQMNVETKVLEKSSPNGSKARRAYRGCAPSRPMRPTNGSRLWNMWSSMCFAPRPGSVEDFIEQLIDRLRASGVQVPPTVSTPYTNTIPPEEEPDYPGDREIERRIKSYIRWNAMAMVVNANRKHDGLGGHISTFASSATLYEVDTIIFSVRPPPNVAETWSIFRDTLRQVTIRARFWKGVWITTTCTLFVRNWLKAGGFRLIHILI